MARLSRIVLPGYPHHVTQRGVRSMDVFHTDKDRGEYLRMLSEETARSGVTIRLSRTIEKLTGLDLRKGKAVFTKTIIVPRIFLGSMIRSAQSEVRGGTDSHYFNVTTASRRLPRSLIRG